MFYIYKKNFYRRDVFMKHYDKPMLSIVGMLESDVLTVSNGNDMTGSDIIIDANNPWGGSV